MFYCKECQVKNNWPEGFRFSHGPCEVCHKTKDCFDIPSSRLPLPKPDENKANK